MASRNVTNTTVVAIVAIAAVDSELILPGLAVARLTIAAGGWSGTADAPSV
jgi:hypothetical protein